MKILSNSRFKQPMTPDIQAKIDSFVKKATMLGDHLEVIDRQLTFWETTSETITIPPFISSIHESAFFNVPTELKHIILTTPQQCMNEFDYIDGIEIHLPKETKILPKFMNCHDVTLDIHPDSKVKLEGQSWGNSGITVRNSQNIVLYDSYAITDCRIPNLIISKPFSIRESGIRDTDINVLTMRHCQPSNSIIRGKALKINYRIERKHITEPNSIADIKKYIGTTICFMVTINNIAVIEI